MRVLVACEFSGIVRDAFLRRGHDAISCDLLPTESPGPHYHGDVRDILGGGWDLMVAHPDCTYLCSSGLHWNKRIPGRQAKTEAALNFVKELYYCGIPRIAIENPIGCIGTRMTPASQFIQPHEHGHDASKRTGLWLRGVPLLVPTKSFAPRLVEWPKDSGKIVKRWGNQTDSGQSNLPPSDDRWKLRAKTYQGWADAMAEQWGRQLSDER